MGFEWHDHQFVFRADGSLRDLYVFDTAENDWDHLLQFAEKENAVFIYDGERRPLPDSITSVKFGECAQLVAFRRGAIDINCHMFTLDEIEMDIDPKQVTDQSSFEDVLSFLRDLGRAMNKNVVLTDESSPQSVWISYDAFRDDLIFEKPQSRQSHNRGHQECQ